MQTQVLPGTLAEGAHPERIDTKLVVDPVDEVFNLRCRDHYILDDVVFGHAVLVKAMVENFGVQKMVKHPAEEVDIGNGEVGKNVAAGPEGTTVVAEEIVRDGDSLFYRGWSAFQQVLDMKVVPEFL